jgi:hypothetical protein
MTSAVETALVAPTILKALGLNPNDLDGVRHAGTAGIAVQQPERRRRPIGTEEWAQETLPAPILFSAVKITA